MEQATVFLEKDREKNPVFEDESTLKLLDEAYASEEFVSLKAIKALLER